MACLPVSSGIETGGSILKAHLARFARWLTHRQRPCGRSEQHQSAIGLPRLSQTAVVLTLLPIAWLLLAPLSSASADSPLDYATDKGHFYTQANGFPIGQSSSGFEISDDGGVPFWREFRMLGGVHVLGYPISRRFEWDGFVCQATQRAVLQWDPGRRQVQLVNVLDDLSSRGRDAWLRQTHLIPRPLDDSTERGLSPAEVARRRLRLLDDNPSIRSAYYSAPEPAALYGLPTSEVVDVGAAHAVRFQRAVLFQWKSRLPWAEEGQVTSAFSGDLLKAAGLLPPGALTPEPPPGERRFSTASRGGARDLPSVDGIATWYGRDFHGRLMSNLEPYNMHDPKIAAANAYPLGTILRVTHRGTGAYVVVRVTDRGAFRYPIVVDLSHAAFSKLGNPDRGILPVRVEPVR